jgi:hypothetical protein
LVSAGCVTLAFQPSQPFAQFVALIGQLLESGLGATGFPGLPRVGFDLFEIVAFGGIRREIVAFIEKVGIVLGRKVFV